MCFENKKKIFNYKELDNQFLDLLVKKDAGFITRGSSKNVELFLDKATLYDLLSNFESTFVDILAHRFSKYSSYFTFEENMDRYLKQISEILLLDNRNSEEFYFATRLWSSYLTLNACSELAFKTKQLGSNVVCEEFFRKNSFLHPTINPLSCLLFNFSDPSSKEITIDHLRFISLDEDSFLFPNLVNDFLTDSSGGDLLWQSRSETLFDLKTTSPNDYLIFSLLGKHSLNFSEKQIVLDFSIFGLNLLLFFQNLPLLKKTSLEKLVLECWGK